MPEVEGAPLGDVAWRSRAGGVLSARALRSSPRGARREGRSAAAAAFFEDRNIDRCGGKGSQLTWMRQLRRIDRAAVLWK